MFHKTADTESISVIDNIRYNQVFSILGKKTASELEVLRVAKGLGLDVAGKLHTLYTINEDGTLSPKEWA